LGELSKRFKPIIFIVFLLSLIDLSIKVIAETPKSDTTTKKLGINFALGQKYNSGDRLLIARIVDKLFALAEVKQSNSFIDSFSHHTHGIAARVMSRPDKSTKYYWIAVGYDNDERFETYYNFYVLPDKMTIKYLDTFTGKALTLAEWRKNRKPSDVIK